MKKRKNAGISRASGNSVAASRVVLSSVAVVLDVHTLLGCHLMQCLVLKLWVLHFHE